MGPARLLLAAAAALAVLLGIGLLLPDWLLFLGTITASHGLVSVGLVLLMRGGVISFGQGLVFALGGYGAALGATRLGIGDALALTVMGGLAAGAVAAAFGPLLARYGGIFFGMLTLALSMVLYGILVKWAALGGSDGFNMTRPTLFGARMDAAGGAYRLYAFSVVVTAIAAAAVAVLLGSVRGLVTQAILGNALRVEYLGVSTRAVIAVNFALAGVLGGLGGALTVIALGHIEPTFAYWTQSGEFVFVAILAGPSGVSAVFVASFLLELVRSFSNLYFPNTWQMVLGLFLLAIILFLPNGIGSLWSGRRRRPAAAVPASAASPAE